jgi:hypothetical protein
MHNRFGPALTCAAWLTASAALAQPAAPPPQAAQATAVAPLTVQAAAPPKAVEKRTESFVKAYAAPTERLGQYARWRDRVCIVVTGLIPGQGAQVKARTEDVAKAVGLKVASSGCKANIEIEFADQPQRLLDWVAEHSDSMLGYHRPADTAALKTVTRPIQAWYKTATRGGGGPNAGLAFAHVTGADGSPVTNSGFPGMGVAPETVDNPANAMPTGCGDSRYSACLEAVFKNVLVVVDNNRLKGQDLGLVSDYVAMLALSQSRSLDGCAALPSVIDLFSTACPGRSAPDGLTPADAAYLTALYKADLEAKKAGEQSDVADRMAKILIGASQGGR